MIQIDMEMPKSCYKCPMNQGEYSPDAIEKRYCCLSGKSFDSRCYRKRPDFCPMTDLVAVKPVPIAGTTIRECAWCHHLVADGMDYCPSCGCPIDW